MFCLLGQASESELIRFDVNLSSMKILQASATIAHPKINESSGLLQCSWNQDFFWTINDSGDQALLFLIHRDGSTPPGWEDGVLISGIKNNDWEALARSPSGEIVIADMGNNNNQRRDLQLVFITEPLKPTKSISPLRTQVLRYPEQTEFPPKDNNFDCEALVTINNALYLFTKNRSNFHTTLYRVPVSGSDLEKIITLDLKGQITGADISPQGDKLAILAYNRIWVFTFSQDPAFWEGEFRFSSIFALQCEAISFFDQDTLIITNEQRSIYQVDINQIPKSTELPQKNLMRKHK